MGKSYRKVPIFGITTAKSEKKDKQRSVRAKRVSVRASLAKGAYQEIAPKEPRDGSYSFSKDGKRWWSHAKRSDMRK